MWICMIFIPDYFTTKYRKKQDFFRRPPRKNKKKTKSASRIAFIEAIFSAAPVGLVLCEAEKDGFVYDLSLFRLLLLGLREAEKYGFVRICTDVYGGRQTAWPIAKFREAAAPTGRQIIARGFIPWTQ